MFNSNELTVQPPPRASNACDGPEHVNDVFLRLLPEIYRKTIEHQTKGTR